MTLTKLYPFLLLCLLSLSTCSEDGDFNVFSIEQDLELGRQTAQQILNNPAEYPVLEPRDYPQAYLYLQNMVDEIVREGNVPYADVFPYTVTLIRSDQQNAFATPGGFIYVYTGLVEVLDSGDQLAGVLGHEIAHASQRHSTDQLTKQYGISTLLSVVSGGDPGLLTQIGSQLLNLKFSRDDEAEADARSVDFLCNTDYASNGAAGFFEMIQSMGGSPAFLSTHPNPGDRVEEINDRAADKNCDTDTSDIDDFRDFQQSLP